MAQDMTDLGFEVWLEYRSFKLSSLVGRYELDWFFHQEAHGADLAPTADSPNPLL